MTSTEAGISIFESEAQVQTTNGSEEMATLKKHSIRLFIARRNLNPDMETTTGQIGKACGRCEASLVVGVCLVEQRPVSGSAVNRDFGPGLAVTIFEGRTADRSASVP
jgi:hypothetical protein